MAKYKEWREMTPNLDKIEVGESLDFLRLIPTYTDRREYYLALLEDTPEYQNNKSLISKGVQFFLKAMEQHNVPV